MRISHIIAAFGILLSCSARANPDYVKNPRLEALDNASVFSFHEDSAGSMWIATGEGLSRFDGNGISLHSGPLPMRRIIGKCGEDVFYYQDLEAPWCTDARSGESEAVPVSGHLDIRHASFCIYGEDLYSADASGIWRRTGSDSLRLICSSPEPLCCIASTVHHGIVAASRQGTIYRFDGESLSPADSCGDEVKDIFEDSKGRLWVGFESIGIIRYSRYLKRDLATRPDNHAGEPARKFRTFLECSDGCVLAGCLDGLFIIDKKDNCTMLKGCVPEGRAVCSLYKDSSSNIWIGAFYGGVFFCEREVNPFEAITGDNLQLVNAMVEDRRSDVWAVTDGYGLYRICPSGNGSAIVDGVAHGKMKSAYYDQSRDVLWIGGYLSPLMCYDIRSGRMTCFHFPDPTYSHTEGSIFGIRPILGELWLQTSNDIYLFDPSRDPKVERRLPGFSGRAEALLEMDDSRVWIGGPGLFVYENGEVRNVSDLSGSTCYDIVSKDGELWLGTSSGIMEMDYDGRLLRNWTKSVTGLADNMVYRLAVSESGLVVAGTNSGITVIDPTSGRCYNYSKSNGLGLSSVKEGSVLCHSDGSVWVGGTDGAVRLPPSKLTLPDYIPRLSIEGVRVNNKDIKADTAQKTVLHHSQNNISFRVSSHDVAGIVPSFCEARLYGAEKEWHPIYPGSPLVYMRLKPGNYTFCVRAKFSPSEDAPAYREESVTFKIRHSTLWSPIAWIIYLIVGFALGKIQYVLVSEYIARHRSRKSDDILSIARNRSDEEFLSKVVASIDANISNSDYAVEDLCREAGASQTLLGSRLKSITGYSPRDFIEFLRLRKAFRLLSEGNMNISQVADAVGFSSQRYFATRFKKHFAKTPSEVIAANGDRH